MGRAAHRARRTGGLRTAVAVVPAAVVVIAVGLGSLLTQDGAVAATETWTPTAAESSAPPVASTFGAPNDVHHESDGALLVADFSANGLLRRAVDGRWSVVAPFGTGPGDVWNPSAVTTTGDGRILVAEAGRPSVTVLDADGTVLSRTAPPARRAVSELAVAGSTVYAAVPGSGALFTTELGSGDWTAVPGPWTDPSGVALSADGGTLTVSDAGADQVWQVDRSSGAVTSLGFPGDAQTRPRGVAVDDGDVFVVDNGRGAVWALTGGAWTEAFSSAPDGSPLVNPTAVSVGPGRSLVVADYNRQRVVTAASSGRAVVVPGPTPTSEPTVEPTVEPTSEPTSEPTVEPTVEPTAEPTAEPTVEPTSPPTSEPTAVPTTAPGAKATPSMTAAVPGDGTAPPGPSLTDASLTDAPLTDPPLSDARAAGRQRTLAWTGAGPVLPALLTAAALVAGGLLLSGHAGRRRS
ncbi:PT domain-containing protein [Curtobacterium sp. RHCJP20]|uniref:PT domain-containing protein n=1 Tax=Curtobacterium subtropicum TaxID=3055138 RepID=A0ABT7TCB7_9MICO|nr:PT domain-containing protein [Curtobacterium subtropicum]MDM7887206.1 PT domain-containing protein [Curtobacterium subtropicum]